MSKASSSSSSSSLPDSQTLDELATFANQLADEARQIILPYWRQPITIVSKIETNRAVAESPVTIADQNCELKLRQLIESKYPNHGIYGEEYGSIRTEKANFIWVLDPIDGTKSFITGKPLFGTLIACLYKGIPIIGIIDQCVLKERWVGIVGQGTTFNGQKVTCQGVSSLKESMVYATTPHMFATGEEDDKWKSICHVVKRPLYGADCYAYGLLASGYGVDLVVEADLGLYDYCALVPIVEGAGGIMTDWNGRRLTLQNHISCHGRVVACANLKLHQEAIGILQQTSRKGTALVTKTKTTFKNNHQSLLVGIAIGVAVGMILSRRI